MATRTPYLTKSRYVQGIACEKLLWLGWHERLPYEEPEPGSPAAVGIEIGKRAHVLFPGGIAVIEEPWQHDEAVARTAELMADPAVPAIFEAAFTFDNIRIRADVIERLESGQWGLREVKSSTKVKPEHIDDAAIQFHVMRNLGIEVTSVELVHVDSEFVLGEQGIDWQRFFARTDLTSMVESMLPELLEEVASQHRILAQAVAPDIPASPHCPDTCNYWDRCTAGKPADWIMHLPRISQAKFDALHAMGIESIGTIPEDFELTEVQDRVREVILTGRDYISPNLAKALAPLEAWIFYLDFEAMNPAIPLFTGTRPYQRIPFQWSLHTRFGNGPLKHQEFLADAASDPRRAFATSLIDAIADSDVPIAVYSSYERSVLSELARDFPDLADQISDITARLIDLLAVVRREVYLASFNGSFSIKTVGPALAPGLTYDDLETVRDGEAASIAFQRLAAGGIENAEVQALRNALLAYCARDTLAMVAVHDGLRALVHGTRIAAE